MNEILIESAKPKPLQAAKFAQNESHPPMRVKSHVFRQYGSVPVYFHCLGGNWEGRIQLLNSTTLEIWIQGMPPVQQGQILQFQSFRSSSSSPVPLQPGMIRHIHIQQGSSVWERTTSLLIEPHNGQQTFSTLSDSPHDSFAKALGSFVTCRVTNGVFVDVSEREQHVIGSLQPILSTHTPLIADNNLESQPLQAIQSSKISLNNRASATIIAYHDYPIDQDLSTLPIVVLAPGYGETKRDYLTLAYYFACNGFHVIRYDHTNHVGESQGRHFDISLSSMKHDFQSVVEFAHQQWPQGPVIGVASSLSARVALKAEREEPALALLVLLVGIVDVQQSVATVHQDNVFANYLTGQIQDSANILGFNVGRQFLCDAVTNGFATLDTTLNDVETLTTPVMYVSAGKDAWIEHQALATFKQAIDSRLSKWLDVPEALHRLQENPKVARNTYRQIIQHCREQVGTSFLEGNIQEPNRGDLGKQNRQEKFAQSQQPHTHVGQTFWSDYLGQFQTVGTCQDYVQLLDHVFHALGPITSGQRVLDAGCGNGNVGLYFLHLLKNHPTPSRLVSDNPIRYVGIDVVPEALNRAQGKMLQAVQSSEQCRRTHGASVQMSWAQVDLQDPLPFVDDHFDRIVSNLVVGYVSDSLAVLRELYRVLAPGGRMVLSNLKPNGDFSGIYQNLVSQAGHQEQKAEARELLNNYGKIRQAEKEGQFRFFDHTEWKNALKDLNCVYAEVYPTFANQAYLIVLEKPEKFIHASLSSPQHSILKYAA
ncbi:MAG: methyltransferase domain-containing protein [Nitrospirota bacterium]|nr:methyltransferase domain-containing protein [Nitrospirota bacterium]